MGRKGDDRLYAFVDALVATGVREIAKAFPAAKDGDVDAAAALEAKATEVMIQVANSICFQYKRSWLYVPVDMEMQLTKRDQQLWEAYGQDGPDGVRKYTGERVRQLSEQYELTTGHVYCILRVMHKREVSSRQMGLPGLDADQVPTSG